MLKKTIVLVWVLFAVIAVNGQEPIRDLKPTVVLVSLDGFRADYLAKYQHPTLDELSRTGVRARWMTPSYPSLTFPNHYTIATGLYPEHTGIVANDIYDPEFNAFFALSKREEVQNGRWWGGEPIWITAEKQGQKASATFWPGSEAEIKGRRASYWKTFDDKVTPNERVDGVLSLLDLTQAQRPTFLTLYLSNVDHEGHEHSPESKEVADAIKLVDDALNRLIEGLRARQIYDGVNLIVVSDHGMAAQPPNHEVVLDDYFDAKAAEHISWGNQVTNIFAKNSNERRLLRSFQRKRVDHAKCYAKHGVPSRFHYRDNRRIGSVVCMAEQGYLLKSRSRYEEDKKRLTTNVRGAHGYDNLLRSMRAIFIAHGPAFKKGVTVAPFPNIDVYNIMTRVLKLKPAKNDGSLSAARAVLR